MSGISGSFKVPTLVKRLKKSHGLPYLDWDLLRNQKELASGSFGTVYTANYGDDDRKVVVKKLKGESVESKRRFLKEAEMMNGITHENIPAFLGYSDNPHGLMMEYSGFDFTPFGVDKAVSNLEDFYHYVDCEFNFEAFSDVLPVCLRDTIAGLDYLHGRNIAHRDLKPKNVLVSNTHYCNRDETSFAQIYEQCPVVCKVTDFGLSRSLDAQTQSLLRSRTDEICRGTLVYMPPEIHTGRLPNASQDDLKMADIWSLGILAYAMLNPNLESPYRKESEISDVALNEDIIRGFMEQQLLPGHDAKYEVLRVTEWWQLEAIFNLCTKFEPTSRPTSTDVLREVNLREPLASLIIQNLKVSQNTAIERADCELALELAQPSIGLSIEQQLPENDGTNACAFLAIGLADKFLREVDQTDDLSWEQLARLAEEIIMNLPARINDQRDASKRYDPSEAKLVLEENQLIAAKYELTEECISANGVFSEAGRKELFTALLTKQQQPNAKYAAGIYTCCPYTLLVGIHKESYFLLDTHPVGEGLGGNGNGILLKTNDLTSRSCTLMVQWLLKRLKISGVSGDEVQSFAWMMPKPDIDKAADSHGVREVSCCRNDVVSGDLDIDEANNGAETSENPQTENRAQEDEELQITNVRSSGINRRQSITHIVESSSDSDGCISDSMHSSANKSINKRNVGELYDGKELLPVYDWFPKDKTPIEIFQVLIKPSDDNTTCKIIPHCIAHNVCFLLDAARLGSQNDWKSDDMGSWKNNGVQHLRFVLEGDNVFPADDIENENEGELYTMKRIYYKNKSSSDVKKIVSFLEEHPQLIFIQYIFAGIEHPVGPSAHGNCKQKHSSAYVRTKESTVKELRRETSIQTPKPAYHRVHQEKGGIMKAVSISDLPRNRAQAKYARREHTQKKRLNNVDSLVILLEQCKRQQMNRDELPFIREVTGAPELRCVLGFDWQLGDLATFYTDPKKMSVLGADPTFNLGRFNVTVTSYQNLKVVERVNGHHPTMIGPMLISQTKTFDAYNHFFSKILSLNKDTRGIMAFGTDGEEELYKAMKFSFPYGVHLRCFNHFRDNCKDQLKSSNVSEEVQKQFLFQIFGRRVGETWEKGLLDADDVDDFHTKLNSLEDLWNSKEREYLPSGATPKFHKYILERKDMIVDSMLKEVRVRAGLGSPPTPYYNNIPESANALIKQGVEFKENEMSKFCQQMSILLLRQKEDVESAIINHGPYRLAPEFSHLEVPQDEWFRKSTSQKEACVKKFRNAKMSVSSDSSSAETPSTPSLAQARSRISVDLVNSGIQSVNPTTLQFMSEKVEKLLNKEGSIVQAPGSADDSAFMVESDTMMKPHYVTIAKSGKVICNDCPSWKAYGVCAHALAGAEKAGTTVRYLNWLKVKGPARVNLTSLVTCDSARGVGKKGGKTSTARRKGGRNARKDPPKMVVDRLGFLTESPIANPAPATSTITSVPSSEQQNTSSSVPLCRPLLTNAQPLPYPMQGFIPASPPQVFTNPARLPVSNTTPRNHFFQPVSTLGNSPFGNPPSCNSAQGVTARQGVSSGPTSLHHSPQKRFIVNLLRFCPPLVRSCQGCSQSLKPGGNIANPPYDLTIVTVMNRSYRDAATGEERCREGNVYFHVMLDCIRRKQPYFNPEMTVIPGPLVQHLQPEHLRLLRDFGAHI